MTIELYVYDTLNKVICLKTFLVCLTSWCVLTVTNTLLNKLLFLDSFLCRVPKLGLTPDFLTPGLIHCSLGSDELYKLSCWLSWSLPCSTAGTWKCHCWLDIFSHLILLYKLDFTFSLKTDAYYFSLFLLSKCFLRNSL